jgi:(1->4)-alpha-D-glucan 1-alpha-D-glucosylmutase
VPPAIPHSTYRLQLNKDFGFDDAAALVPYLKALSISHLYASPFLKARAGSTHGYDIVDHNALNPEFGGDAAFARLSDALKRHDLGLILDFVPNHMAIGFSDNPWWLDVLEWGPGSAFAASFDITWELLPYRKSGGVLLPVLGQPYSAALTGGEIELKYDAGDGSFSAWYFQHRFPINPQRYSDILTNIVTAAEATGEDAGKAIMALADDHRHPGTPTYLKAPALKRRLVEISGAPLVIERGLKAYRADHEAGVNLLHRLLERQHYRLAFWKLAPSGINYRRFFDVNELAGLRIEDPNTFQRTHALVSRLIADGQLHGLRLDHIDGLYDPLQYTRRLQTLIRQALTRQATGRRHDDFYVVIEKIVEDGEELPPFTGIAGTTGYEWLNLMSRLLVDEPGRVSLDAAWRDMASELSQFDTVVEDSKHRVLNTILASEFNVLAQLLARIAAGHFSSRDYAPDRLREALELYVLEFPVYRTYVTPRSCADRDRGVIDHAIAKARRRWPGTDTDIFDFLRNAITADLGRNGLPYSRTRVRQFALKLQQFTGPMMAKSLEDTAIYRYQSLIALNEVGGYPTLPGLPVDEFHRRVAHRTEHFSHGLTATATHDTKRGEDARVRILALSEVPALWEEHVTHWRRLNARFITVTGDSRSLSVGHEYLLYQTLIGAWPHAPIDDDFIKRIEAYAVKAAREGKLETSWISPNEDYERGLRAFAQQILRRDQSAEFLHSFDTFARRTTLLGALNSLSQLVLKATIPGVPDFYQGTELWDLSLVDPDNRRPVDFDARHALLSSDPDWKDLTSRWTDGHLKFALTRKLLQLRAERPALFQDGHYKAVEVSGPDRDHVIAFMRVHRSERALVVAGRHFAAITEQGQHWPTIGWNAELQVKSESRAPWRNVILATRNATTSLDCRDVMGELPIAVLTNG